MNGEEPVKIVLADKRRKTLEYSRVTIRPVVIRGEYMYQAEFQYDRKVTHRNIAF